MLLPTMDPFNADEILESTIPVLADKAWKVGPERMVGWLDGLEAVRQAAWKRLNTEAGKYDIYDATYGIQTTDLIGAEVDYAVSELQRRIKESLLRDDRISDVTDFTHEIAGRKIMIVFVVVSNYGNFDLEMRVQI